MHICAHVGCVCAHTGMGCALMCKSLCLALHAWQSVWGLQLSVLVSWGVVICFIFNGKDVVDMGMYCPDPLSTKDSLALCWECYLQHPSAVSPTVPPSRGYPRSVPSLKLSPFTQSAPHPGNVWGRGRCPGFLISGQLWGSILALDRPEGQECVRGLALQPGFSLRPILLPPSLFYSCWSCGTSFFF